MGFPFSRDFSISISKFTPETTNWHNSTSENPSLSAFDTSYMPPSAAVSTPPV